MKMDILPNIKNILKRVSFCILLLSVFSLVATEVAEAKTITNSTNFANSTQLDYFDNLYKRSGYKYYLLGLDNSSDYNYYNDYYICLTNESFSLTDEFNTKAYCSELYRYYRGNNTYNLVKVDDNTLEFSNSVFYTSNIYDTGYFSNSMLFGICIGVFSLTLIYVLFKLFGGY